MKRLFRFNREEDDFGTYRWYIDLPEYPGVKADLEMVSGADTMLERLSEMENYVECVISDDVIVRPDLRLMKENEGGDYKVYSITNNYDEIHKSNVWLCEVTKFVFGGYPEFIDLKVV